MKQPIGYSPPGFRAPIDLDLSRNEGRAPRDPRLGEVEIDAAALARYPSTEELGAALARLYDVPAGHLAVTAGADDALLRLCLTALEPGSDAVVASPTFEMIPRYVGLARAELREVPWPGWRFPTEAFLDAATAKTRLAFVVSPNNPTGAVATVDDLLRIARELPEALVVLDAAYAEFAEDELPAAARGVDNVVVLRTLSKAWGLAGLRVGCAIGAPAVVERIRAAGNPMPVSAASIRHALHRLEGGRDDVEDHVRNVKAERRELAALLGELGTSPAQPSRGNFVLTHDVDPSWTTSALAALGIAVRRFPDRPDLQDAVRIGLPGDRAAFARLCAALRAVLAPAALLFDMDGVLADVTRSYRAAIVRTAESFGVTVTPGDIAAAKARGNANDDWALTRELMTARGVEIPLVDVIERFEAHYRELRDHEEPMVDRETLRTWGRRYRLAVVTGRPREDADWFLRRFGMTDVFDAVVCREDAPLKPDPAPVRLALERLGVEAAWMLGDTTDDHVAARGAGVVPIAVGPHDDRAAVTLGKTPDLREILP